MPTRSGVPVRAQFTYDTTFWGMKIGIMQQVYGKGLVFEFKSDTDGDLVTDQFPSTCPSGLTGGAHYDRWHRVIDFAGRVHWMSGNDVVNYRQCYDDNGNVFSTVPQILSAPSTDGEYYFLIRAGQPSGNGTFVWKNDGNEVDSTDTNGNILFFSHGSAPPGEFTTNPVSTSYGASSTAISVKVSDGTTQTYTLNYTTYGTGSNAVSVPTSIVLPDSTKYVFTYDSANRYMLSGMTLPTGGQVSFVYNSSLLDYNNNPQLVSATFEGGTWTFNQTKSGSSPFVITTTVSAPPRYDVASQANVNYKTIYTSTPWAGSRAHPYFLASAKFYSGASTLVKTVSATYDASVAGCLQTLSATLNDTGQTSNVKYQYGTACSTPTQEQYFDYGATTPTKTITYSYLGDVTGTAYNSQYHMYNRPTNISVHTGDATGPVIQSTTFTYDEYSASYCQPFKGTAVPGLTTVTGALNHDDNGHGSTFTARGNVTTTKKLVSGTTYATSHVCYDTLGNITQKVDEAGHATNYEYTENWADSNCVAAGTLTRAQLTTVTSPMGLRRKVKYYSCTRLSQAEAGENDIAAGRAGTIHTYDFLNRPLCVTYAGGGQLCNSYFLGARPPYVLHTTKLSSQLTKTVKEVDDSWSRMVQTQLTSDPEGTIYSDTGYDGRGHTVSVSNPYRSTSEASYGTTAYSYDALGGTTVITQADNSKISTAYSGNTSTTTDEAGKKRKIQTNAFGQVTNVWEDPTGLNYETDYTYDVLGNLLCVQQRGGVSTPASTGCAYSASGDASSPWRIRRFGYDGLSRVVSTKNPESGTVLYTYYPDGPLQTRVAPAPNQTGSTTLTTTYSYDADHRLTQKTYTDGTATVKYGYDGLALAGCAVAPPAVTDNNSKGNRTSMCDASGSTSWSHDPIDRPLSEQRVLNGQTKAVTYAYNLFGSPTSVTYPSGHVITYGYNAAGRAVSAVDTTSSVNYVTGATYAPHGAVAGFVSAFISGGFTGITNTNTYNKRLQPLTRSASAGSPLLNLTYDFHLGANDNGNVFQITNNKDNTRSQTFGYDSLNRVTSAQSQATTGPNCWGNSFTVDPWGNLTNKTVTKCSAESLSASASVVRHN